MAARANGVAERAKAISHGRYQRLGDNNRQRPLGRGTYGVVYLAWDSTEHRFVAIREHHVKSPDVWDEARVMHHKVGNHAHLVHVWDVVRDDSAGKWMIILEYLPNSLAGVVKRAGGFVDMDLCYSYGRQVLEAVDFLHARGVVHGDISLNNILVDGRNNAVKLSTDFGMAAGADTFVFDRTVTELDYTAPETILYGTPSPGKTYLDMWSLATVWAVLWSASNVFHGKSLLDVFRRHAYVLGGTLVRDWPECQAAPKWGEVEGELAAVFPHSGPRDFFLSSDVGRPLHSHEQIMDLLCKVFQWRPCHRLPAHEALNHPAWKHVPQPAELPSPEKAALTPPAFQELCKCRGHCGRKDCNRNKARIYYLKKMNKEVIGIICRNQVDASDPRGRCSACTETGGTPTPPASQTKASDAQGRKQEVKGRVSSKASQKRRRDSKAPKVT